MRVNERRCVEDIVWSGVCKFRGEFCAGVGVTDGLKHISRGGEARFHQDF